MYIISTKLKTPIQFGTYQKKPPTWRWFRSLVLVVILIAIPAVANGWVRVTGSHDWNGTFSSLSQVLVGISQHPDQRGANIVIELLSDQVLSGVLSIQECRHSRISPGDGNSFNSLTIRTTGQFAITGDIWGAALRIQADNVTIDGYWAGARALTIRNVSTHADAAAITIDGCDNLNIRNVIIENSTTSPVSGGIRNWQIGGPSINVVIDNNLFRPAGANMPVNHIFFAGSVAPNAHRNITIRNNLFENFHAPAGGITTAVRITEGGQDMTITGNRIYQTAPRSFSATAEVHGILIHTPGGGNYNITFNVIGFANATGTGTMTYSGPIVMFSGIQIRDASTTVASHIHGNQISNINITTSIRPSDVRLIDVRNGWVNIGNIAQPNTIGAATGTGSITLHSTATPLAPYDFNVFPITSWGQGGNIVGNRIGAITATSAHATGTIHHVGIHIRNDGSGLRTVSDNIIGSLTTPHSFVAGTDGLTTSAVHVLGIIGTVNNATGSITVSNNTIANLTARGISGAGSRPFVRGIEFQGVATSGTLTASGNTIRNTTAPGAEASIGILSFASPHTLNITGNIIRNHTALNSGFVYGIMQHGAPSTAININNNQLGNADGRWLHVPGLAPPSGTFIGIWHHTAAPNAALTISGNDFRGASSDAAGFFGNHYIHTSAAYRTLTVSNNTFTNISERSTAVTLLIHNTAALTATGTQVIDNNRIVGSFTREGDSGWVALYLDNAAHAAGSTVSITNNNFSNVSITGAAAISVTGLEAEGTGQEVATIRGNVLNNFSTGNNGGLVGISLAGFSGSSIIENNIISNFTNARNIIEAIKIEPPGSATNLQVLGNTIHTLSSTGVGGPVFGIRNQNASPLINIVQNTIHTLSSTLSTGGVEGIRSENAGAQLNIRLNTIHGIRNDNMSDGHLAGIMVLTGSSVLVSRNRVYNISSASPSLLASGYLAGIGFWPSTSSITALVANNLVSDIRVTAGGRDDIIHGILLGPAGANSTYQVYYNTVFLNAPATTAANLGSNGIRHTANTTATTGSLDMRNNIIVNLSEQRGTGRTIAFRRDGGTAGMLANYATTSNHNLFFAGTPGSNRLIYFDGVSSAQTLRDFKTGVFTAGTVAPREARSISINPVWQSTIGADANFLNINTTIGTPIESGAMHLAAIGNDIAGNIRHGHAGYIGTGIGPDIGAWEFEGTLPEITWDGEAGTVNWSDPMNWIFDFVPTQHYNVRLNGPHTIEANMAAATRRLVIDHDNMLLTIPATRSLTVHNDLNLINGRLDTREDFPSVTGAINITGGTVGYTSTLRAQTVAALTYHNLFVTTPFGATAAGSFTVNGQLHLAGNPASPPTLGNLSMGAHTLTMGGSATTTGTGDITGRVRRTAFLPGVAYTFGSEHTTLLFQHTAGGTLPTEMLFNIEIGAAPVWEPRAVRRVYDITRTGGNLFTTNLTLRYLDAELNNNLEMSLIMMTREPLPGITTMRGRTAADGVLNRVSLENIPIGDFAVSANQRLWFLQADPNAVLITGNRGWRMIASPTATTYADLVSGFVSQGFPGSTFPARQPNLMWFSETDARTTNMGYRAVSSLGAGIVPGRGYYFYVFGQVSGDPDYNNPLPILMEVSGPANFTSGTFPFSGVNHPVTFTPRGTGQSGGAIVETNAADQGWNLLGNPSQQTLNWNAATGWTRTNLDNTIYIWDANLNDWRFWNGMVGNHDGLIPPLQGFWVRANAPNPVVSFTDQVFSAVSGTFRSAPVQQNPVHLSLRLTGDTLSTVAFISFTREGITGRDAGDAYRLEPLSDSWAEVFTLSSPAHTEPLVINHLPLPEGQPVHLPMFVGMQINNQRAALPMELQWELPANWPADWTLTLHDHTRQQAIDMTAQTRYRFDYTPGLKSTSAGRPALSLPGNIVRPVSQTATLKSTSQQAPFTIAVSRGAHSGAPVYVATQPRLFEVSPNPFRGTARIAFSLPEEQEAVIAVYDMRGIRVDIPANGNYSAGVHELTWTPHNSVPGVYIIRLYSGDTIDTQKVIYYR